MSKEIQNQMMEQEFYINASLIEAEEKGERFSPPERGIPRMEPLSLPQERKAPKRAALPVFQPALEKRREEAFPQKAEPLRLEIPAAPAVFPPLPVTSGKRCKNGAECIHWRWEEDGKRGNSGNQLWRI